MIFPRYGGMVIGSLCIVFAINATPQSRSSGAPAKTPPAIKPAVASDLQVPFHVGETLTYDVSWANTISAGTATMVVNSKTVVEGGRTAYDIVAEAKPGFLLRTIYPIYYKLESLLDTKTLLPITATMYSEERTRKRTKTTKFLTPTSVEYEFKTATSSRSTKTIERQTYDPLSLFYVVRGMTLTPGQVITVPIIESGKGYSVSIRVGAFEQITTGAGKFRALHLTPTFMDAQGKPVTDRKLSLWISDDARHLPLRFESVLLVGSFVMNLTRVTG